VWYLYQQKALRVGAFCVCHHGTIILMTQDLEYSQVINTSDPFTDWFNEERKPVITAEDRDAEDAEDDEE